MRDEGILWILIICLSVLVQKVEAIKCWRCEGVGNCGDPFDDYDMGICKAGTHCKKATGGDFGSTYVRRECSYVQFVGCKDPYYGSYGAKECYCNTDFCNSSTCLTFSTYAFIICSFLGFLSTL